MATRKKTPTSSEAAAKPTKRKASGAAAAPAMAKSAPTPQVPSEHELHEQIRHRAYEIYQQRGGHHGASHDDWFQAEREVMARYGR